MGDGFHGVTHLGVALVELAFLSSHDADRFSTPQSTFIAMVHVGRHDEFLEVQERQSEVIIVALGQSDMCRHMCKSLSKIVGSFKTSIAMATCVSRSKSTWAADPHLGSNDCGFQSGKRG